MTSGPPPFFAWYALGTGFLLALAVVAVGVVRLVLQILALKKRVVALKTLPFEADALSAQAKIAKASRRIDTAPALIARAQRAVASLGEARDSAISSALGVRDVAVYFFTPR